YSSAYPPPFMSLQSTFANLYSFFSVEILLLSAMAAFEISSFMCTVVPSSNLFSMGRVVSG
ncbi:hypothetical protein DM02DRAFT_466200, partial [Periconia macrospinosa]